MKILFTGGGTGGHFYPIIAIAEKLNQIIDQEKIIQSRLYFMSTNEYDKEALLKNGLVFVGISTGKMRLYPSIQNFFDYFKIFFGAISAIFKIFSIYPDVIVGKGGYASFPALFAARALRIPVIIHESDSVPGKVNKWAGKFAKRVAISFAEASEYFPKEKIALTGVPIRQEIIQSSDKGVYEYLKLDPGRPTILILGGSQGAKIINETILETLPELLNKYQIIHQVGNKNIEEIESYSSVILEKHPHKDEYRPVDYLNPLAIKMSAGAANLVISRAGASAIFEIAAWGTPSIIIPISKSNGDHQRKNAFNYARSGACVVLEETNLEPHILIAEINRIMDNKMEIEKMKNGARSFAKFDASEKIAREIINLSLEHEK